VSYFVAIQIFCVEESPDNTEQRTS